MEQRKDLDGALRRKLAYLACAQRASWIGPFSRGLALKCVVCAGKTTLLDVLAGRKTVGKVGGTITLNGQEVDPTTLSRLTVRHTHIRPKDNCLCMLASPLSDSGRDLVHHGSGNSSIRALTLLSCPMVCRATWSRTVATRRSARCRRPSSSRLACASRPTPRRPTARSSYRCVAIATEGARD
jgi:hypothetical protein